ncbi:MAG: PAS domain S-box protein [Saprospiraceae bacterium]|nr:PAS domain S-box protein [Saprospiraceae bacterium]
MAEKNKIIQDISLLYELSLLVGSTLDPVENCHSFLRTLVTRKSLTFGSVWLNRPDINKDTTGLKLFYIFPGHRQGDIYADAAHWMASAMGERPYLNVPYHAHGFENLIQEKKVGKGSYAIFKLGNLGYLKLFAENRPEGFQIYELEQLTQVIEKLSVSLDGSFAHAQLKEETERRVIAQTQMESLISNLKVGILLENEQRVISLVNKTFCEIFGINEGPHALIGRDCDNCSQLSKHLFSDAEAFVEGIDAAIANRRMIESEVLLLSDGRILERDSIPIFTAGQYHGHLWQYRDVTEKHYAQVALRESEEKYRGVLENMELGLVEVTLDEVIIRHNNAFCQMLGYEPYELIGRSGFDLILTQRSKDFMAQLVEDRKKGLSGVYEIQLIKKDGSTMWSMVSGAPVKNAQGQTIGTIGILFDLTNRIKLETELAEAKQAADRARLAERQFLTHMSHEIRTPINAVIGMTHLLYDTQPDQTQREYLDSLSFSAESLLAIVDDILDLSKIEAGEIEFEQKPFDLGYLIKSLHQTFQYKIQSKPVQFTYDIDPAIVNFVTGDRTHLNQILTNLLSNAVKFTEQGAISIAAKLLERREDLMYIQFTVTDTGIGIAENKLELIFQNFKQADIQVSRKYGGTGLGLTIVKQLVELQGGSILVESQVDKGSRFSVVLPFTDSKVAINSSEALSKHDFLPNGNRLKNKHFLVVEDNQVNQMLICKTIQSWEGTFEVANHGKEALELTAREKFDVILMDIHMPELDGFETTRVLRADSSNQNCQVPVIALTAVAMPEEKRRALEVGMNGFLTKPYAPHLLEAYIVDAIQNQKNPIEYTENEPSVAPFEEINLSYLTELAKGDETFLRDIIHTYCVETPPLLAKLQACLTTNDWEQMGKVVHQLKSNYTMFGMEALRKKAIQLETDIKSGRCEALRLKSAVEWLIEETGRLLPKLTNKLL